MSGIAGIFHRDGKPVDPSDLDRMLDAINHRGSDSRLKFIDRNIALGLNLMVTTPEARYERLFRTSDSPYVIAADARIDNRDELIEACGVPYRPINEIPDSELIVAAYEKWGEDCPKYLLGDFAFAIWDRRKRKLFCARDHMGIKPVLYHCSDSLFAVATEVKAILQLPSVPSTINEPRIADFLEGYPELIDKTSTFYTKVKKLAGARLLGVSNSQLTTTRYWSPSEAPELHVSSDDEYEERFRHVFRAAVHCRLRSAKPVGAMLSGGLDSSAIVCVAQKLLAGRGAAPLRTFSGVADEGFPCPERPYVDAVRSTYSLDATIITADRMPSFFESICGYIHASDDLFDSTLVSIPLAVYQTASESDCNVVLDGVSGDNVVSVPQPVRCRLMESGSRLQALWEAALFWRSYYGFNPTGILLTLKSSVRPAFSHLYVPEAWKPPIRRIRDRLRATPTVRSDLINPEFASRVNLADRIDSAREATRGDYRSVRDLHASMIKCPIIYVANDRYDRAAAYFGIEARRPFLDKRLVEFCVSLPFDQKQRNGWTKWICRNALAGVLPDKIRWRQTPSGVFFRFYKHLYDGVGAEFRREVIENWRSEAYLNRSVLEAALKGSSDSATGDKVFQAYVLLDFLGRHL